MAPIPALHRGFPSRLTAHGIDIRSARSTAVLALAGDLSSPILSQILGIHINTAGDWGKYVKRDWTCYIDLVSDELVAAQVATDLLRLPSVAFE
jgi:hypothetical protein